MGQQCRPNIRTRAFSAGSDGQWVFGPGSANFRSPQITDPRLRTGSPSPFRVVQPPELSPYAYTVSEQTNHLLVISKLFLDSDSNHVVICYLILRHQPGHPPLPSRFCVRPRSLSAFDCQLLTSSSSTFQCAGRLPRLPRLPRPCRGLCRGTSRAPGPGVGACPDLVGASTLSGSFSGRWIVLLLG